MTHHNDRPNANPEKVANLVTQAAGVDRLRLSPYYYDQECNSGIGVSFPQNIGKIRAHWAARRFVCFICFVKNRGDTDGVLFLTSHSAIQFLLTCAIPMCVTR